MKILNNWISLLATIALLLNACQQNTLPVIPEYLAAKEIPNWNEIYPMLMPYALEWDSDVRLDTAFIQVNWQNHPEQRLASAFFQSPNKELETLHLEYLKDGTIKVSVNSHGVPIPSFDPIEKAEWKINSIDAWELFLENQEVVSSDPKIFDCSSLVLTKKVIGGGKKTLIWQLSLADCERTVLMQYFIDAYSGEYLGVETH